MKAINIFQSFPLSVVTILSNRNPGTAAKFFDEQYVHIPSDRLILRGNIQKLVKVQEEVEKEEQDLKDYVHSLILSLANLKMGRGEIWMRKGSQY